MARNTSLGSATIVLVSQLNKTSPRSKMTASYLAALGKGIAPACQLAMTRPAFFKILLLLLSATGVVRVVYVPWLFSFSLLLSVLQIWCRVLKGSVIYGCVVVGGGSVFLSSLFLRGSLCRFAVLGFFKRRVAVWQVGRWENWV
ncbi:hypothetical protein B0T17DRAFT_543764 [Bombardia bombarda]|uniref:Uncharacterized protein n=1 Tax=Bombardia bombarda TaxID=252184 RepID=A0AA39WCE0_9PEZI|nr:hypothetical protein B0T17DRAFT_543764 [Bombardia bombarda]